MIALDDVTYRLDSGVPAEQSVILRYAPALYETIFDAETLASCTLREGVRLVELTPVNGVRVYLLDESSCMATGTYKSLDGCVTSAASLQSGARRIVFSSGANTGSALTAYASRQGIETFFFCPESTVHKVDARILEPPHAHLVSVEGPDARVKEVASRFAEAISAPLVPTIGWRLLAAASRGMFIAELANERGCRFDWVSQAVCAAFGPIGLYRVLLQLVRKAELDPDAVPRFLGIQQAGLAPIVEAWAAGASRLEESPARTWREPPIEPSLYNANPTMTYPQLHGVLREVEGDMRSVSRAAFERESSRFIDLLESAGITLTMRSASDGTEPIEKAGLLCGVGTLQAIDDGRIRPGQSVLCSLSGGVLPSIPRPVETEFRLEAHNGVDEGVGVLLDVFSKAGGTFQRSGEGCRESSHAS